jgi:putative transposase
MPWRATDAQREKVRFVSMVEEGAFSVREVCERFGISRQTGHTLLLRWREEGIEGLKTRSRAPKHSPQRMLREVEQLLVEERRAHPRWGPRKILAYLRDRHPDVVLPAASTVGDLYRRHGLIEPRKRQRRWAHPGRASVEVRGPNDLWTADYKGEFRTRDGKRCYPLTVADASSRYLLACRGLESTAAGPAREVFERIFREHGLPKAIRTDNGPPFATKAIAGLSRLNIWWTKLGLGHDRTDLGRPDQNGSHERMHRTLKDETVWPPAEDMAEQQVRFDRFDAAFNEERPHEALGQKTPASLYENSPRAMPEVLPAPEYGVHCVVRRIRGNGILYFRDQQHFLSELLIGEDVALEEIADGVWSISFYGLLLGRLDERVRKICG